MVQAHHAGIGEPGLDMGKGETMENFEVTPAQIAEVKRELPMVKMTWNGKKYWGRVSGRLCEFASVYPYILRDNKKRVTMIMGPISHFAWETVTRAYVYDRELIA